MALFGTRRAAILGEYTRSICKCIPNWCSELPKNLSQSFLKFLIDYHMLIDSEILRGKLGECRNSQIRVRVPITVV